MMLFIAITAAFAASTLFALHVSNTVIREQEHAIMEGAIEQDHINMEIW